MTLRSSELEALFGTALAEVTAENVRGLVTNGTAESEMLEFKSEHYPSSDSGRVELAKDVAALANRRGGVIVIGVTEDREARAAATPGVPVSDGELGRIRQTITSRVAPFPDVDVRGVTDELLPTGTGYVLLIVNASVMAPHAVVHDDRMRYPVRHGTTTRYLTEPDVADAYRRRFVTASAREDRLAALAREATPARGDQGVLIMTLVPERLGAITIDADTFQRFREFAENIPAYAPWHGAGFSNARVTARSLRAGGYSTWGDDGEFAAYIDGAGTYTRALEGLNVDTTRQGWPDGELHFVVDEEQLGAAVLCGVRNMSAQAREFAGASGLAILSAQVVGPAGRAALHLGNSRQMVARAYTDALGTPEAVYSYGDIDSTATFGPAGTAVAAALLNGLGHSLGAAEMQQLTRDGQVRVSGWSSRDQTQLWVQSWAHAHAIDVVN